MSNTVCPACNQEECKCAFHPDSKQMVSSRPIPTSLVEVASRILHEEGYVVSTMCTVMSAEHWRREARWTIEGAIESALEEAHGGFIGVVIIRRGVKRW